MYPCCCIEITFCIPYVNMKMLPGLLKKYRKKVDMTQREVADELRISLQAYKHYEAGRRVPSLEMASRIADVFGITIDELIGK